MMNDSTQTTDGRPNYCLHNPHPSAEIEAEARAIYMARYGASGGWWELVETPEIWWRMAVSKTKAKRIAPPCGDGS